MTLLLISVAIAVANGDLSTDDTVADLCCCS